MRFYDGEKEIQLLHDIKELSFETAQFWDIDKDKSKINLLVCGSVYSLMHKIFEDYKAPLFGRATRFLHVKPFKVSILKQILADNYTGFST
jgi:AAA+ ATPase superfamily predicted ATPase